MKQERTNVIIEADSLGRDTNQIELAVEKICGDFKADRTQVNIKIVGDAEIKKINQKFLNEDKITDVISFDLTDDAQQGRIFDIVVNAELAQRQSQNRNHRPQAELMLYIVHGLLHNFGFDDTTASEAAVMHKQEDDILEQLGFGRVFEDAGSE